MFKNTHINARRALPLLASLFEALCMKTHLASYGELYVYTNENVNIEETMKALILYDFQNMEKELLTDKIRPDSDPYYKHTINAAMKYGLWDNVLEHLNVFQDKIGVNLTYDFLCVAIYFGDLEKYQRIINELDIDEASFLDDRKQNLVDILDELPSEEAREQLQNYLGVESNSSATLTV